jgi:uncharacterized Zn-binding protein involved in type VI secretion
MSGTLAEHCVKAKAQESCNKSEQYNRKRHNASIRQKTSYGFCAKFCRYAVLLNHIGTIDTGFKGLCPKKNARSGKDMAQAQQSLPFDGTPARRDGHKGVVSIRLWQTTRKHDISWPTKQALSFPTR